MNGIGNKPQIATFEVNVTPDVGDSVEYGIVDSITDPLSCRGIVILGDELPIVLVAVDWLGNFNGGYDFWRHTLANAANTTADRVAVHAVHQHEAPGFDLDAARILFSHGITDVTIDVRFAHKTVHRAAAALREALHDPISVTHLGVGTSEVEKVASNRQLLGADGQIHHVRYSAERDPEARDLPKGVVDPTLRMISFWNGDDPLAVLSYYATHPQSYYGDRAVTCDFVGLARNQVETTIDVPIVHFNGAAGNVTAGKYNDGSKEARSELTRRLEKGMMVAWESTKRVPITVSDVSWQVSPISLPVASWLEEEPLVKSLSVASNQSRIPLRDLPMVAKFYTIRIANKLKSNKKYKYPDVFSTTVQTQWEYPHSTQMARDLVWLHRCKNGNKIPLTCLQLGNTYIINAPGELFVEYQLALSETQPDSTIAVAAYGDSAPFYIGTKDAYHRGGFEVDGIESKVSPEVEEVLFPAMCGLLGVSDDQVVTTPSEITRERKPRIEHFCE